MRLLGMVWFTKLPIGLLHFSFILLQGDIGDAGPPGPPGISGTNGLAVSLNTIWIALPYLALL